MGLSYKKVSPKVFSRSQASHCAKAIQAEKDGDRVLSHYHSDLALAQFNLAEVKGPAVYTKESKRIFWRGAVGDWGLRKKAKGGR